MRRRRLAAETRRGEEEQGQDGGISDAETEAGASAEPVGAVVVQGGGEYVPASDSSDGGESPAPLPDPVAVVPHRAHRHASAWATMGAELMDQLELVALKLRERRAGRHLSTAPVDACEMHITWDKMVRAVNCDDNTGCLFDTSRASTDSE